MLTKMRIKREQKKMLNLVKKGYIVIKTGSRVLYLLQVKTRKQYTPRFTYNVNYL